MATQEHQRSSDIVAGVDGSEASTRAAEWAAHAAQSKRCRLRLVYALSMPLVSDPFSTPQRMPATPDETARAEAVLAKAHEHVTELWPDIGVETEISPLFPVDALREASGRNSLVVIGSRGLGAMGSVLLGSVSVRVAEHADAPVVVVPPDSGPPATEWGKVVVGVDGSAPSVLALRFALDQAARNGAELNVVHAWQPPAPVDPGALAAAGYALDRVALTARSRDFIGQLIDDERTVATKDVPVDITVTEEPAARALLDAGEDAELVAVGSRGRGGFKGLLLGSVSRTVLNHARVPVAVLR